MCLLDGPRDESWMQSVAAEMNLSETAFLQPDGDGFALRWFTPTVEVDLCGHATLASAHVLWETGALDLDAEAVFETKSGRLSARRRDGLIYLDFPSTPEEPAEGPPLLASALGVTPVYVGRSRFDYLVEVESEELVRGVTPDFALLGGIPVRGVMVTAKSSDPAYDFVSRFFGPAAGINEDPVTGSAHCCLGPYWQKKLGKDTLRADQASRRGGTVEVEVRGDRVLLGGNAVTILRGSLVVNE